MTNEDFIMLETMTAKTVMGVKGAQLDLWVGIRCHWSLVEQCRAKTITPVQMIEAAKAARASRDVILGMADAAFAELVLSNRNKRLSKLTKKNLAKLVGIPYLPW